MFPDAYLSFIFFFKLKIFFIHLLILAKYEVLFHEDFGYKLVSFLNPNCPTCP